MPSLERLAELIERVVELLDEVAVLPTLEPARSPPLALDPEPDPLPSPAPNPGPNPAPSVDGHLLFVSTPDGYRLLERQGAPPPARGDLLEVEGIGYSVLRLGPSPLPGDWRRCAYLEGRNRRTRIEPSTGERREPDPRHARRGAGRPRAGRAGSAAVD